jgi:AhpD family alkylhydroperoxidase
MTAEPAPIDYVRLFPAGVQARVAVQRGRTRVAAAERVTMRASQVNDGACVDMHCTDARARGEFERRLRLLAKGRDVAYYATFSSDAIVALALAIVAINGWNRLAISPGAGGGHTSRRTAPTSNRCAADQRVGSRAHAKPGK